MMVANPGPSRIAETISISLSDLLTEKDLEEILIFIPEDKQKNIQIVQDDGLVVFNPNFSGTNIESLPLTCEMELIGQIKYLSEDQPPVMFQRLIDWIIKNAYKYKLISEFHLDIVQKEYESQKELISQLQHSKEEYKKLSESLQKQVSEQVKQIHVAEISIHQQERLATVGRLAAGVAHEINNPLSFVESNLRTASSYLEDIKNLTVNPSKDADQSNEMSLSDIFMDFSDLLEESEEGCQRISSIVSDLKDFTSETTVNLKLQTVDDVIKKLVENNPLFRDVGVKYNAPTAIKIDGASLARVIENLIDNSMKAVASSEKKLVNLKTSEDENHIVIQVIDNGVGMDAFTIKHATEPFFTTRDVNEGRGLGLSVSKDIIGLFKGSLEFKSAKNSGTIATIKLPMQVEK